MSLYDDIKDAINRHSAENASNTPDYVLATFACEVLDALNKAVRLRDWHSGPAPKEPEPAESPAEPAQDDEVSDELQWAIDGFGEAAYDWADSNTDPESQLGERERQKERELKAVIAREKADMRAKLEAAEAALVARHGGEPLALLAELDEARAKLAAAEERIAEMRKVAATFLGGTALGRMIEQEGGA